MLAAWHQLRDRSLWRPWFERDPAHALPAGTDPDVPRLQAILTDWMRGGRTGHALLAAALSQPLATAVAGLGQVSIVTRAGHPWEAELRSLGTDLTVTTSPDDRGSAASILSSLGS